MRKKKKKILYDGGLLLCVAVFLASGAGLSVKLYSQKHNDAQMESLAEAAARFEAETARTDGEPEGTGESAAEARRRRLPAYGDLKARNPDMTGWVTIPGTKVDYPVMQSPDRPDYYLKHGFDGGKSRFGVPYIAESCTQESLNTIIYGHHMKDGSMFAELMGYTEEEFFKEHPTVWFDTLEGVGEYRVIGALKASAATERKLFKLAAADNEEEYGTFLQEVKDRSFYDTGETAVYGDKLLTLITCEYTLDEGRLLVVAKKAE